MENEHLYQALADALRERLAVIADRALRERDPASHLDRLKAVSEKIVRLQSRLPSDIPARLTHFLEGCSYDKALALLDTMLSGNAPEK